MYTNIENALKNKEKSLIAQQNILNKEDFENKLKILTKEVQNIDLIKNLPMKA